MSTTTSPRIVGRGQAVTMPYRREHMVVDVEVERALPCITIMIHGVNDLGTDLGTLEEGICEGLNERLGRGDLKAGVYTQGRMANDPTPIKPDDLLKDFDAVMYRRQQLTETKSPVIPFYWGYRADKNELHRDWRRKINGQNVDIHGNRLDKNFAKNGGMFANATSNIPDMFDSHFNGNLGTWIGDKFANDPTHPLLEAPNRRYMILAAKRLAMLVRQIRLIDPDETVNIVGHSQGTLIALLAQAYLMESNRPADTLVLINSPYSLDESAMDQSLQRGDAMQTVYARVKTLANLVDLVASQRHAQPAFTDLEARKGYDNHGVTGLAWGPSEATRIDMGTAGPGTVFAERDNRGKVYMYFCPEDATVGLANVNGMGCVGLPDSLTVTAFADGARAEIVPLIKSDGPLRQRIFTRRLRQNQPVKVGTAPGPFVLREKGESAHGVDGFVKWLLTADIREGESRAINAEALNPPFDPELQANVLPETANAPLRGPARKDVFRRVLNRPYPEPAAGGHTATPASIAAEINAGKKPDDQVDVLDVLAHSTLTDIVNGTLNVTYRESYNDARARMLGVTLDNETKPGKQSIDQLEVEIALTRIHLELLPGEWLPWPGYHPSQPRPSQREIWEVLNAGKDPDDQCELYLSMVALPTEPGQIYIARHETPNEAKVRLMNSLKGDSSYHSAVMSGKRNHRYATAMDLSVGQGLALEDPEWAALLRAIADWRIPFDDIKGLGGSRFEELNPETLELVEATCEYYKSGKFPVYLVPKEPPPAVVSETVAGRPRPKAPRQ